MINAFLSYRHGNPEATLARSSLKELCEDTKEITLIYDEDITKEGDNLIHFMEDLIDARCIFIFLDPDYFHSSYTLFELISISEQVGFDASLVHPVRLSEDMVTYTRTAAKQFWNDDKNEAIRVEVGRLLEKTNRLNGHSISDYDAIWERVEAAWSTLVTGYLDELHPAATGSHLDAVLQTRLDCVLPAIAEAKEVAKKELTDHVKKQIQVILERRHISLPLLAINLKDPEKLLGGVSKDISHFITSGCCNVRRTMTALYQTVEQQKSDLKSKKDEWEDCISDAEQFIGWLLLLSVDTEWWFEKQNILDKSANEQVLNELFLEDDRYIEVVISRGLLSKAGYKLDDAGDAVPRRSQNDIGMLYDATSDGAEDLQYLSDIYKDLFPSSSVIPKPRRGMSQIDFLLGKIKTRAESYKDKGDGRAIYYLVSFEVKENLLKLDWYKKAQAYLKGYIRFICCEPKEKQFSNASASNETMDILLEDVAVFLELIEQTSETNR